MSELNDHELLREYARSESETAFAALVTRYINLVYSTGLRCTGNPHHAEEISQAVFIILTRKAGRLSRRVALSGWLYQTTRLTAANFTKKEIRRQRREQEAGMQSNLNETGPATWAQIAPLLDEAMGRLREAERRVVVLRYFENRSAAEIGAALQISEANARQRVARALEKLRKFFAKRGLVSSAAAIAENISTNSVHAAPVGLAATISATVAKGSAVAASTLTLVKGTLKVMTYAKLKVALGIAAAALLAAGTVNLAISGMPGNPTGSVGKASAQERTFAGEIMKAVADENYPAFIAEGNSGFKTITKAQFNAVCLQDATRLKTGYQVIFLGGLKEDQNHVTVWKISYADGGNDDLLRLAVRDGKISGALLTPPF